MVWLRTLEGAVLFDPGRVDGWRQIALVQVLFGLNSQHRQVIILGKQQHALEQVNSILFRKALRPPLPLDNLPRIWGAHGIQARIGACFQLVDKSLEVRWQDSAVAEVYAVEAQLVLVVTDFV